MKYTGEFMRALSLFFLLSYLLSGAALAAVDSSVVPTTDIKEIPEYLPYNIESLYQYRVPLAHSGWGGYPLTLLNVDQDPDLEIIRSKSSYILCEDYSSEAFATHWQLNFPVEFHCSDKRRAAFNISSAMNLGTDKTMVVVKGTTADFLKTRFWVIDTEAGEIVSEFDLPGGPDLNGDGHWDGTYSVLGEVKVPTNSGLRPALIILCDVGFDLEKRGAYAVDPWTGEIFWDFQIGAQPTRYQCKILDLDGNGTMEILLTTRAPNNLHGRKVNGFSDDRAYLFALGADGTKLWHRELCPDPCTPYLQTGDLDGDGELEIVMTLHSIYKKEGSVSVLNTKGELKAELLTDYALLSCFLIPSDQENKLDIITGNRYANIMRIGYEKEQLTILKEATNDRGICIFNIIDLQGQPGEKGIITQDRDGTGRILDREFNIVASYIDDEKRFSRQAIVGNRNGTPSFLLIGSNMGSLTLEANPLAMVGFFSKIFNNPRTLLLSGLGLGMILAWLIIRVNRRNQDKTNIPVFQESDSPLHLKERRLHLLEDLEVSNHGAMAPLRSLRRLLWMLDAVQSGVGVNPNLVARMKEIWQDCHEDALPRLTNILERARLARVTNTVVDEALASIYRINSALSDLNEENFAAESVNKHLVGLHKEEKTTEALLQSLRRQVSDYFRTPLSDILEKVLRANQHIVEECGVVVQTGMVAVMEAGGPDPEMPAGSPICRMDSDELGFILDNLVGNACRSMASAPRRDLRITWQPVSGVVKIEVTDTGIGIATEDHQRVLEPGFSARPGGGLGLPKSQRLLKKYDGHLSIKRSQPGQGTTFLLVVPRA